MEINIICFLVYLGKCIPNFLIVILKMNLSFLPPSLPSFFLSFFFLFYGQLVAYGSSQARG